MDDNEMPNEIYIQLGENRTGLGICLRRWQETPFEGGIKYTRAQPKYKRVDLEKLQLPYDEIEQRYMNCYLSNENVRGYNRAIDDIKSKYGDLYVEVK